MVFWQSIYLVFKKSKTFLLKFFLRQTFVLVYFPVLPKIIASWKSKQRKKYFPNYPANQNRSKAILLIIHNLGLEDCLLLRFPLSLLQQKYPNSILYFHADNQSAKTLLKNFCHDITFLSWKEVQEKEFLFVYDLMLNELPSVWRLLKLKTTNIKGIGFGYKRLWYDVWLKPQSLFSKIHIIDYWLYLFGIDSQKVKSDPLLLEKYFYLSTRKTSSKSIKKTIVQRKQKKEKVVVFAPFTGYDKKGKVNVSKSWSLKNYLMMSKKIYQILNIKTIWIGIDKDLQRLPEKSEHHFEFESLIGKTNLNDIIFLLKNCHLLFTNATGVFHLATLLKTPTLRFVDDELGSLWKNYCDNHLHKIIRFTSVEHVFTEINKKIEQG